MDLLLGVAIGIMIIVSVEHYILTPITNIDARVSSIEHFLNGATVQRTTPPTEGKTDAKAAGR